MRRFPAASRCSGLLRAALVLVLLAIGSASHPAFALQAVTIDRDQTNVDLTARAERYAGRGDKLQIETAAGPDGVAGRVEVKAQREGTNPGWMVFALRNTGDRPLERWLVAERFTFIGSGIVFPDLDAARIAAITPSQGFLPERIASDRADIFQITVEPGQTVTFVAEMASERFPAVNLWKPFLYESKQRERTLLNGILLGITVLLALFLTALFAANHKVVFPTTGLLAWSVLALLCVDFRFWHRIFKLSADDNALYRAAAEAAVAASLVIFLYSFLKLARWHSWIRMVWLTWIAGQLVLVAMAPLDPGLAATLARSSFVVIGALGSLFILYLILANQDRAFALLPSWLLLLVWIFAAAMAVTGRLNGEFIAVGLISGLVLILLIISFTVTQFAFRTTDASPGGSQDGVASRSYAIEGAGAATWEWNSKRNEVATGPMMEEILGLQKGELNCSFEDWLKHVRLADRDRLRLQVEGLSQRGSGHIQADFQMRGGDGSFRWFALRGSALPQADQKGLRCVGLLRETTIEKRAHERLVLDAVRDTLTGLPNRELFLDRLNVAFARARQDNAAGKIAVLLVEIDRFDKVLEEFGTIRADSMLLAVAKRLGRTIGPHDTLARTSNDQFAILTDAGQPLDANDYAERLRRSVRAPMKLTGRDVILTASIGIAGLQADQTDAAQLFRDADSALFRAKRGGADRIELFLPSMRMESDDRSAGIAALRKAMERKQIIAHYQPVYGLSPERLAGFECVLRWEHPRLGPIGPNEFMDIAELGGFALPLALQCLEQAIKDAAAWQKLVVRSENPLFVSVNLGDHRSLQPEFVQEVRTLLGRHSLPKGSVRLDISDRAMRENPERAAEVLDWLHNAGAGVILTDFGSGQLPLGDLSRFAIDGFRLDRWLCFDALADGPGAALVRGIVALARELGHPVIADSVESQDDVTRLRSAGCSLAMGPLYGDPLGDRQLEELLSVVRTAEHKNERRGIFGGSLLARSKKPVAAKEGEPLGVTKSATAAKSSRKKAAANGSASSTKHTDAVNGANGEAFGYQSTADLVDYDEEVAAAMIASAHDATQHYQPASVPATQSAKLPPSVLAPAQAFPDREPAAAAPASGGIPMLGPSLAAGLARLQRGTFGLRPSGGTVPAPAAVPKTAVEGPDQPPVGISGDLPEGDVLLALAKRLEEALRRDS